MGKREQADFILGLLTSYRDEAPLQGDLTTVPFPDTPDTIQLRNSIEEFIEPSGGNTSNMGAIECAKAWWKNENTRVLKPRERFLRGKILLSTLDEHFSKRPIMWLEGTESSLIVGLRIWNVIDRGKKGKGFLDKGHRTLALPFPHLRQVPLRANWYEGKPVWTPFSRTRTPLSSGHVINIGLCAFSGKVKTVLTGTGIKDKCNGIHGFIATGMYSPPDEESRNSYSQELIEAVKWATESGIHILAMPELCVCEEGLAILQQAINKTPAQLVMVFPGSFHVPVTPGQPQYVNAAPVWLVGKGQIDSTTIEPYKKCDPFAMDTTHLKNNPAAKDAYGKAHEAACETVMEDISPGNAMCLLNTPIGIIGVCICKDLLFNAGGQFASYATIADHLFVLSMNNAPAYFPGIAQGQAHLGCAIYYVNARQVIDESMGREPELAFWMLPCKCENLGKSEIIYMVSKGKEEIGGDGRHNIEKGHIQLPVLHFPGR